MPAYMLGRWRFVVSDAGTIEVFENGTLRETIDSSTFEARGTTRPAFASTQPTNFDLIAARVLALLPARRAGQRRA